MHDTFTNGVPDAWYSGTAGDLWVEYKWIPRVPKRTFTVKLTKLQLQWLTDREAEGRAVNVVVGCPAGAAVLSPSQCEKRIDASQVDWITIKDLARWITRRVTAISQ